MFKSVLVPATGTQTDAAVFATARLAVGPNGHIDFLHVRVDVADVMTAMAAGGVGIGSSEMNQKDMDRLESEEADLESKARTAAEAFCAGASIAFDHATTADKASAAFITEAGQPADWLADYGRFADLIVIGRGYGLEKNPATEAAEATLLDTGRPILIAPHTAPASLVETVVIGWTDTQQTARAVASAMPLIEAARQVVILSVHGQDDGPDATTERLRRSLFWHNANVSVRNVLRTEGEPIAILLAEAMKLGASTLVMGGYSHSPLRELLFGGATKTVLSGAEIPVLMAH